MGEGSPIGAARFGRYALGPELGAGGMATVTFGVATGALGFARPVAIKRIHPTLVHDSAALRDAIRDEARIASRVRHPNVVAVLDVIEEADDVGIVLEYIHGEALSSLLRRSGTRREPLPIGVALAVAVDVLHGLHAAHTAVDERGAPLGIVHRDVSPQNVIVGADGVARVLDFGISKAESRASVTRDGQVKGKLRYMAPEQLGGEVTPTADTYAVGIVLWEALAGCSPFEDIDEGAQLLGRVLSGVTVAPSAHRQAVSPVLDAIVARALEVRPASRFPTAAAMAE
ncbi:MAG TPA: serine/threonine-protein kinase, partial [Labilithrix sp.]|nr:serine/threonine-protein kinase [Labilithrix sp.]